MTLKATLPADSPILLPDADVWRRWVAEVTARLEPFLPAGSEEEDQEVPTLYWRCKPAAQLCCDPDSGQLYLARVELPAWQGIDLPRQWDNPEREPDPWPDGQLADFARRVRRALQVWEDCLKVLHSPVTR